MDKIKEVFEPKQPVVPASWEIIPFQKAVSIISDKGKRIKQKEYLQTGEFPIIDQGQDYIGGYTDDKNLVFDGELPVIIFGDHTRTIKHAYEPFAVGADGIKILKPENCYSFKFFFYLLKSLQIPSRGYSRHFQFLRNFYFPLPPLPEQHRIVAEIEKQFSRLDEAAAGLKRIQANLKRYRASVLKSAVEGKLTAEWRKQHPDIEPAEQLLQRILKERRAHWEQAELEKMQAAGKPPKDDKWKQKYKEPVKPDVSGLTALPEGWVWVTPEQLTSINKYALAIGPFGSNLKVSDYCQEGVPLVFVKNIRSKSFDGENTKYVSKIKAYELTPHKVNPGDILITKMGEPPGDACIYPLNCPPAIITADCIKWKLVSILDNVFFFIYAINSQPLKLQIQKITKGVAQQKISLGRFKGLAIPLPSLQEQAQIVSEVERRLSIADEVEQQINTNLKRAERLRQVILKKAFSGRLVPQDPDDEPADVLLEKIKQAQRA